MENILTLSVNTVVTEEEILQRYAEGWRYLGVMGIAEGSGIVKPGEMGPQAKHVWILPFPTTPLGGLIGVLAAALVQGYDAQTLNVVCVKVTGRPLSEFVGDPDPSVAEGQSLLAYGVPPARD